MNYHNTPLLNIMVFPVATWAAEWTSLNAISWLAGQWISVSEQSVTSENWQTLSDSTCEGFELRFNKTHYCQR